MKKILIIACVMGLPFTAFASRYNSNINYGQVVEVEPIYQRVSIPQERQVCERRQSHYPRQDKNKAGRAILGGIIGGAIGNRFGKGNGRDASTALGVLIGASVGANKQPRYRSNHNACYVETFYHDEERFMGYDVTYEYNGDLYHTQMQEHPGDRVRLRVNIDVVD